MTNITRRAALGGLTAVAAAGGTGGALMALRAFDPETPMDAVHRLAEELSAAMGLWQSEMTAAGYPHPIECVVRAQRPDGVRPVHLRPVFQKTPEQRVQIAQAELIAATKACHPEICDWRIVRYDDDDGSSFVGPFMIVGRPRRSS